MILITVECYGDIQIPTRPSIKTCDNMLGAAPGLGRETLTQRKLLALAIAAIRTTMPHVPESQNDFL